VQRRAKKRTKTQHICQVFAKTLRLPAPAGYIRWNKQRHCHERARQLYIDLLTATKMNVTRYRYNTQGA
jgi:hypothetical protein